MSGIIGHITYAMLGRVAAEKRGLPVVPVIDNFLPSYLAGTYLGIDIMTLPGGVCTECGDEWGYCGSKPDSCPNDGSELKPYLLEVDGERHTPIDVHDLFYGRTHLMFGWQKNEQSLTLNWEQLPDYFGHTLSDAVRFYGPGACHLAYILGWIAHVVGDALIKSVQPGLKLHLLNGTYTPQNRPLQDLYSFHEVGQKDLGLDWDKLMSDLAHTPVESVQAHYMRATEPRGNLAEHYPDGWKPELERLLTRVMEENRRYQRIRNRRLLKQMELATGSGWRECDAELAENSGIKSYDKMVEMCEEAEFRRALEFIGESVADMFAKICSRAF